MSKTATKQRNRSNVNKALRCTNALPNDYAEIPYDFEIEAEYDKEYDNNTTPAISATRNHASTQKSLSANTISAADSLNNHIASKTSAPQRRVTSASAAEEGDVVVEDTPVKRTTNYSVVPITVRFSLVKFILLSILTMGIYSIYCFAKMGNTLNRIASRYDGRKTMNFWLLSLIVAPLTFGLGYFVWPHRFCARLGRELHRRGVKYSIGAGTFWIWCMLGTIIVVGPFIYIHKLAKAMNLLVRQYNIDEVY